MTRVLNSVAVLNADAQRTPAWPFAVDPNDLPGGAWVETVRTSYTQMPDLTSVVAIADRGLTTGECEPADEGRGPRSASAPRNENPLRHWSERVFHCRADRI